MRKKRVAYRKRPQNRFSMFLVTLVVVLIMVAAAARSVDLQQKIDVRQAESEKLDKQIKEEQERTSELEEFEKEVKTKGYIEDVAREKLGLIYEGEILFKKNQ